VFSVELLADQVSMLRLWDCSREDPIAREGLTLLLASATVWQENPATSASLSAYQGTQPLGSRDASTPQALACDV